MGQKLWHWTGPADPSRPNYYLPLHVSLTVEDSMVRVVLYSENLDQSTMKTATEMAQIISDSDSLPISHVERLKALVDGSFIDPTLAGTPIRIKSIFNIRRDAGFFGSGEVEAPLIVAFPLSVSGEDTLFPTNVLIDSYASKRASNWTKMALDQQWPVVMTLPYSGASFMDASFVVRNDSAFVLSSNIGGWETISSSPPSGGLLGTLPTIALLTHEAEVAAGADVTVNLKIVDSDGALDARGSHRVYLEETGGYLPLRRVTTSNGLASFRICALGMSAGDVFKVKAGFRNFTGCDEIVVRVV